jgi:acyl-CoA synthetase (AMP-forming)/AMP-acid ligase II
MHYTSGTTGRRKGVWSGLLDEAAATALLDQERALWHFDARDRHLVFSPLYHSAPLRFAIGTLMAGGTAASTAPRARSALTARWQAGSAGGRPLTVRVCDGQHRQRLAVDPVGGDRRVRVREFQRRSFRDA